MTTTSNQGRHLLEVRTWSDPDSEYDGWWDPEVRTIWVRQQRTEGMLDTLIHEAAHALLGHDATIADGVHEAVDRWAERVSRELLTQLRPSVVSA